MGAVLGAAIAEVAASTASRAVERRSDGAGRTKAGRGSGAGMADSAGRLREEGPFVLVSCWTLDIVDSFVLGGVQPFLVGIAFTWLRP